MLTPAWHCAPWTALCVLCVLCSECEVMLEGQGPWQLPASSANSTSSTSTNSSGSSSSSTSSSDGDSAEGHGSSTISSSSSTATIAPTSSGGADGSGEAGDRDDAQLVFTPGHTSGCVSLLYRPAQALFSGDHLGWSHRLQRLTIFRAMNWHSVEQQLESAAALRHLEFSHLLPGHGRRAEFADGADRVAQLEAMLAAEGYAGRPV